VRVPLEQLLVSVTLEIGEGLHAAQMLPEPAGAVREQPCYARAVVNEPSAPRESDEDDPAPHAPAGTWASEGTDTVAEDASIDAGAEALEVRPAPVREPPRAAAASARTREMPRAASASASPREPLRLPARPPFLASELLRSRDERREPIAPSAGRIAATLGGLTSAVGVGMLFAFGSAPVGPAPIAAGSLGAALAASALVPLPPLHRALTALALALPLLVADLWLRGDTSGAVACASALATNAGLVLRAQRHGSLRARGLVGLGGMLAASWLLALGIEGATVTQLELAAVLGPLVALTLVVHLGLTLLAFVDDHGSSGGAPIAALGFAWALAEALCRTAEVGLSAPGSAELGAIGAAAVVPAAAIALAQLLGGQPAAKPGRPAPAGPEALSAGHAPEQAARP